MPLYLSIIIASFALPLALSFDKKVRFYKLWPYVLPSIAIVALAFIIPDIILTRKEVWGFTPTYHSSILLWGLPLEEILFFIVIPYCSIFAHYTLFTYFPNFHLSQNVSMCLTIVLMLVITGTLFFQFGKVYTSYIFLLLLVLLAISLINKQKVIQKFYISYLFILIPFFVVNGLLTGSFIENEVVWYNSSEIIGIRVFTIPIEDFAYGFSLMLMNLFIIEFFRSKKV